MTTPGRTYTQRQIADAIAAATQKAAAAEQKGHSNPYKFAFDDLRQRLAQIDPTFPAELRDRAAQFKAIED